MHQGQPDVPRVRVVIVNDRWRKTTLVTSRTALIVDILMSENWQLVKTGTNCHPADLCPEWLLVTNYTSLPVPPGPPPDAPRCPQCPISGGSLPQPDDASVTVAGSLRRPLRSRLRVLRLRSSSDAVDDTAAARFT